MKKMWIDYVWEDEEGYPLSEAKREYFRDVDELYRRRDELVSDYALIIGVHAPKAPPAKTPLIF